MKGLFRKLKMFLRRMKDAIVELFTGKEPKVEEETVEAEIVKRKEDNSFVDWIEEIGRKIGKNIKKGIDYAVDHPLKAMAAITGVSFTFNTFCSTIGTLRKNIIDPSRRYVEEKQNKYRIYDNKNFGQYWVTNRPMTDIDKQWITRHCKETGIDMGEYLHNIGLLTA